MTTDPKDLDALIKQAREKAQSESAEVAATNQADIPQKPSLQPEGLAKIRTFEHDAKMAIEDSQASLARIKLSEEKRDRIGNTPPSYTGIFWIIISVLIVTGVGTLGYLFINKKEVTVPVVVVPIEQETLLPYDLAIEVDISKVANVQNEALGVTHLRVTEKGNIASLQSVSQYIFKGLPYILIRNADDYMTGLKNGASFLIIKTDYEHALPGMLLWEKEQHTTARDSVSFVDYPIEEGIVRGNGILFYVINKNGFVVISDNQDTARDISKSL